MTKAELIRCIDALYFVPEPGITAATREAHGLARDFVSRASADFAAHLAASATDAGGVRLGAQREVHRWSLEFEPDGRGSIRVTGGEKGPALTSWPGVPEACRLLDEFLCGATPLCAHPDCGRRVPPRPPRPDGGAGPWRKWCSERCRKKSFLRCSECGGRTRGAAAARGDEPVCPRCAAKAPVIRRLKVVPRRPPARTMRTTETGALLRYATRERLPATIVIDVDGEERVRLDLPGGRAWALCPDDIYWAIVDRQLGPAVDEWVDDLEAAV